MAATKNLRTIITAGTNNAAATTTTGTVVNLTTAYGGVWTAKVTNGGTGPTLPATVTVYASGDNVNFKTIATLVSQLGAAIISEFNGFVDPGVMYFRIDIGGNTGQAVTVEAFLQELTTI